MRDPEDRYMGQRRILDLAWRFRRHEARTHTIARWTGLKERGIRTLFRKYGPSSPSTHVRRPRGKSPYKVEPLLCPPRRRFEATRLAQALLEAGVIPLNSHERGKLKLPDIEGGELFCSAFEAFKREFPMSELTIERAFLLVKELNRNVELALRPCSHCGALLLIDRFSVGPPPCENCSSSSRIPSTP